MLYEEITVKNNISDIDFRRYVLLVSQNYFDQETGDYTPYAAREALRYGFYVYCVDGLQTEIEYESLMSDDNLLSIYNAKCLSGIVSEVNAMAKDMAEYEKQKRLQSVYYSLAFTLNELYDAEIMRKEQEIKLSAAAEEMNISQARFNNAQAKALEYQNQINEKISPEEQVEIIKKMNAEDFNLEKWTNNLVDNVTEKFSKTELHKQHVDELLEEKNKKIKELKKYKDAYDARNVMSDNK